MLEQSLRFLGREKYVDPKYRKQIEEWDKKQSIAKGKKIAGAMAEAEKGHLIKGLTQSLGVAQDIREEIKEGDTSSFPHLLALAVLVDIVDFVPIVGTIVNVVAWPILFYGTLFRGRMKYKLGIKFGFIILNFLEVIPVISWLPLESLAIIWLWRVTAKMRREKEDEEVENEQTIKGWMQRIREQNQMRQRLQGDVTKIEHEMERGIKNQSQVDKQPELELKEAA